MYSIKAVPEFGRGLYATRTIIPGEVIMQCELLVFDRLDTIVVNKTALQYYTFAYAEGQDCLVLGNGELFNHADSANVSYSLEDFETRKVMVFRALTPIGIHEQLFINYEQDSAVNAQEYMDKKSLMP